MPHSEDADEIDTVFRGQVITVNVERIALPNGRSGRFEIVHHPGGAAVVAVDAAQQICLLRQFRPAGGGWVWELPAGKLEPDETPDITAQRELAEEAGRKAQRWESLGSILSSPGVFAETIHLFMARELCNVPLAQEPNEVIEVHWLALDEAVKMALSGKLRDAKSIIGVLRAAAKLQGNPET